MANTYDTLILDQIADSLSLNTSTLRWFPVVPLLPQTNCGLMALLDILPNATPNTILNTAPNLFSINYGKLLLAQKPSFIFKTADTNYANPKYWTVCDGSNIATYTPNLIAVNEALSKSASFDFSFDSSTSSITEPTAYPAYPNLLISEAFLYFNGVAKVNRFVFKLHFDKIVNLPVTPANWYTSSALNYAYQNKANWNSGSGLVTWDDLFGTNGIMNFITTGILLASGMTLEIQSFAEYDEQTLNALNNNPLTSIWPFYLNTNNTEQSFTLGEDGSITIKVSTSASDTLLLATQIIAIQTLFGGANPK